MTANEFSRYAASGAPPKPIPASSARRLTPQKPADVDPIFYDWSNSFLAI
jgi:hypothetical protein